MNTHFCGGKAVETTISLGLGNPNCGMEGMDQDCNNIPTEEERIDAEPCCENQHQVMQTDDMAKSQPSFSSINPLFVAAFVQVFIEHLILTDSRNTGFAYYSPPLAEKDVQVLFQTFLI